MGVAENRRFEFILLDEDLNKELWRFRYGVVKKDLEPPAPGGGVGGFGKPPRTLALRECLKPVFRFSERQLLRFELATWWGLCDAVFVCCLGFQVSRCAFFNVCETVSLSKLI